jgi:hypothetical protein
MEKKPRLGPDPLEWIRDTRKDIEGIRGQPERVFQHPRAKWRETYPEKGEGGLR